METLIRQGFSYKTALKDKRGTIVKEITIFYQEIDIYFQVVNIRVNADVIFEKVCNDYINDFIK
jgi:hypothetical protein